MSLSLISSLSGNATSYLDGSAGYVTIQVPAALNIGDMVVVATMTTASGSSTPVPAGWNLLLNVPSGAVWYHMVAAGDPTTQYSVTLPNSSSNQGAWTTNIIRSSYGTVAVASAAQGQGFGGNFTIPAITPTQAAYEVVTGIGIQGQIAPTPTIATSIFSVQLNVQSNEDYYGTLYVTGSITVGTSYAIDNSANFALSGCGFLITEASAPNADTLTSPGNGAYLDPSSGVTFSKIYNSTDGANANGSALRLKASTASSYNYWNDSTAAWQSTEVINPVNIVPGGTGSFGPISGLSQPVTDNWGTRSQESRENLLGPYGSDFSVNLQAGPVMTINFPFGSETTTNAPSLAYTPTPASGASVTGGRWLIYPLSVTQAVGFSINIGTGVIPAGAVSDVSWTGNPLTVAIQSGVTLNNGTGYVAYAAVEETGSIWSSTISSPFTIALDQPATATVTAVASVDTATTPPLVTITVDAHDNILSADDANTVSTLGTLVAGTNTAIALSTAEVLGSPYSVSLTSAAAGAMSMSTSATAYAVEPNTPYTIMDFYRAAVTPETCRMDAEWLDSSGAVISTIQGTAITDSTSGWTPSIASVTSPANAAKVQLISNVLTTAAASEVHYSAQRGIQPGITDNLVYDSNLTNAIATTGPSWTVLNATIGTGPGQTEVVNPGTSNALWYFWGTGAVDNSDQQTQSQIINVVPGQTYTISQPINMAGIYKTPTAGSVRLGIISLGGGTVYDSVTQPLGVDSVVSLSWLCPSGVTQVVIQTVAIGQDIPVGGAISWGVANFTQTSTVQPYQPGPLWSRGGLVGSTVAAILRSDGQYVRGAYASAPAAIPTPSQTLVVYDYEVTPGVAYTYTVVVSATLSANAVISSAASAASNSVTTTATTWWLINPLTKTAISMFVTAHSTAPTEKSTAHFTIGQNLPTIVASTMGGDDGSFTVQTVTAAEFQALKTVMSSQAVQWMMNPLGDGLYVRVGPQPGGMSSGMGNQTRQSSSVMSSVNNPVKTTQVTYNQVARP